MKKNIIVLISVLLYLSSYSQEETNSISLKDDALKVYFTQASSYLKREIPFINYVRDIKDASVQIIRTTQSTGSNGVRYTYFFTGQYEFEGVNDTIICNISPDETVDVSQQKQVSALKMGLFRYVVKTPLAKYLEIRFNADIEENVSSDKWDNWIISPRISTSLQNSNGNQKFHNVNGQIHFDHVTEELKINTTLNYENEVTKLKANNYFYESKRKTKYADLLVVKSLSDHWSYGGSINYNENEYNNIDFEYSIMPGIEYDIYPYSKSHRKQLRFLYQIGYKYSDYKNTTILNKDEDQFWTGSLSMAYMVLEKWGYINLNLGYEYDWEELANKDINASADINLRIAKGLFINIRSYASYLFIKSKFPDTDINFPVNPHKDQETYSYNLNIGLTYIFGSIYNNVVNPRF